MICCKTQNRAPFLGLVLATLIGVAPVAGASAETGQVRAIFVESAPKDSFTLSNAGACDLGPISIKIDLNGSAGRMIFDTVGTGPGVKVYQPLEITDGTELLNSEPTAADGGNAVTLELTSLPRGARVRFTIDVDDTLPQSSNGQTMITGSELSGASVVVRGNAGGEKSARFDASASAEVRGLACR